MRFTILLLKITPIYKGTITVEVGISVGVALKITAIYKGTITLSYFSVLNYSIKDYPDL